jgi:hypothetical protein
MLSSRGDAAGTLASSYFSVQTGERPVHRAHLRPYIPLLLLCYFAFAILLQWLAGAYHAELSGYPDEPGHFVTGVLVEQYLRAVPLKPPVAFAENFYIHRPKIAIGHWPPLLYVIEGIWFLLFHHARASILALMALICAGVAASVCQIIRQRYGWTLGIAGGFLFQALSLVQMQTSEVMADMLVAFFGFWAVVAFTDFVKTEAWGDVLRFAAFVLLAVFTKNNGLYLALAAPLCLLVTRRMRLLRNWRLWAGVAIIALPTLVWLRWSFRFVSNTWAEKPGLALLPRAYLINLTFAYRALGPYFLILALVGFVMILGAQSKPVNLRFAGLACAAASVFVFQTISPAGIEPRFLLPAIPAIIPVCFAGASWIAAKIDLHRIYMSRLALGLVGVSAILSPAGTFSTRRKESRGFLRVADLIEARASLRNGLVLVSSSKDGEGILISELVMRYPYSEGFVLRASKLLASCDWLGRDYKARFTADSDLDKYLDRTGIALVVIDELNDMPEPSHQKMLLRALLREPQKWRPISIEASNLLVFERAGESIPNDRQLRQQMEELLRQMRV